MARHLFLPWLTAPKHKRARHGLDGANSAGSVPHTGLTRACAREFLSPVATHVDAAPEYLPTPYHVPAAAHVRACYQNERRTAAYFMDAAHTIFYHAILVLRLFSCELFSFPVAHGARGTQFDACFLPGRAWHRGFSNSGRSVPQHSFKLLPRQHSCAA